MPGIGIGIGLPFGSQRDPFLAINYDFGAALPPGIVTVRGSNATLYEPDTSLITVVTGNNARRGRDVEGTGLVGLMGELEATNKHLQSEGLDVWSGASGLTVSPNAGTAPDGATTMDKLVEDGGTTQKNIHNGTQGGLSSVAHTLSAFVRADGTRYAHLRINDSATHDNAASAVFDLQTGTISGAATAYGTFSAASAAMKSIDGGSTYRCSLKATVAVATVFPKVEMSDDGTRSANGQSPVYLGDSSSGMFVWGMNFVVGSLSSYIPSTTLPVTRLAEDHDEALAAAIATAFGTEGTLYCKFSMSGAGSGASANRISVSINDGTANESHDIYAEFGGVVPLTQTVDGGGAVATANHTAVAAGVVTKIAQSWEISDITATQDGTSQAADNPAGLPTVTTLQLCHLASGEQLDGFLYELGAWTEHKDNAFREAKTA